MVSQYKPHGTRYCRRNASLLWWLFYTAVYQARRSSAEITATIYGPLYRPIFSRWTWVSRYQNVSILDITGVIEVVIGVVEVVVTTGAITRAKLQSKYQHQQINTQIFLQTGCPSCRPTNTVKALKPYMALPCDIQAKPRRFEYAAVRVRDLIRKKVLSVTYTDDWEYFSRILSIHVFQCQNVKTSRSEMFYKSVLWCNLCLIYQSNCSSYDI